MSSPISDQELEREVRTLKNLRRRSVTASGPGALPVDPDLPPPDAFHSGAGGGAPGGGGPHGADVELQPYSSNDDVTLSLDADSSLFWVPAHLHPELAPGEFRNFLKQHTQVDPEAEAGEAGEASIARSPSWLARSRSMSNGLGRKKSMLSKQYTPRPGDNVEEERVPARRGSQGFAGQRTNTGPTLRDLQQLEELVDDPEFTENPDKMREVLRRSLSQRMQPGLNETTEGESDAPIVAPARPGSIIRRTARTTKMRKHPGRRGGRHTSPAHDSSVEDGDRRSDERRSDETSEETSRESETFHEAKERPGHGREEHKEDDTSNDDDLIFDAYARDRSSTSTMDSITDAYDVSRSESPEDMSAHRERPQLAPILTPKHSEAQWNGDDEVTPTQDQSMSAALHAMDLKSDVQDDVYHDSYADAYATDVYSTPLDHGPPMAKPPVPPAKESELEPEKQPQYQLPPGMAAPLQQHPPSMSSTGQQRNGPIPPAIQVERPPLGRTDSKASVASSSSGTASTKEKTKKGLFGKKHHKDKDREKDKKKDKDGFLGSLFGSKKKQEEPSSVANFATAGPAAAAALLGTSKSAKSLQPSGTASPTSPGFSNFARYPIHVERAVYRLSHIKLANARRPLIEQVLISNLMFWYLGVIGRGAGPAEDSKPGSVNGLDKERSEAQRQPPPKGTPPQSPDAGQLEDKSNGHKLQQQQQQRREPEPPSPTSSGRKTGLVKPERSRAANNSEAAYRAPQYGKQNAQMDHEMRPSPKQTSPTSAQPPHNPILQSPSPHQAPPPQQPTSPPPQPQQQHFQQAPPPQPRTSSVTASPQRTRSPPTATPGTQQRPEYPPGVAPPRAQSFGPGRPPPHGPGRQPSQQPPPGGAPARQPARSPPPGMRPPQGYPQGQPNGNARPLYPQHSGGSQRHGGGGGPQPGQLFQYPGQPQGYGRQGGGPGSAQPGQLFNAQPGQIFHHPQYHGPPQQRGGGGPPPGQHSWEQGQRLPPGGQPPQIAQNPPRRSSSNAAAQADAYGRQTSPTQGSFYAQQQRPGGPGYQYQPGQPRPQPVPSGQYPQHR